MRRPRFRKPTLTLSLFPFLAVLVCTMGALIVLLVTLVQKARVETDAIADAARESAVVDTTSDLQSEKEVHDWRRQILEEQREELRKQLADQRLALSHLEDHIRRLESRWTELSEQGKELEKLRDSDEKQQLASREELDRLRSEIESARKQLEEEKGKAATKRRTFAIIPYFGPNGTKRRPIYIECTDRGIILQPEGIVLSPTDFEGSLGPGNPLDAALRTSREYLARYGDTAVNGEPYPLLIVRPNGTVAYAVARAAIKSWDDEFGYELVDEDMDLVYPNADANLRVQLEQSIADARSRQKILAMAMPGRFKRGASGLVATTNGGFQPTGDGEYFTAEATGGPGGSGQTFSTVFRQPGGTGSDDGMNFSPGGGSPGGSGSNLSPGGYGRPGTTTLTSATTTSGRGNAGSGNGQAADGGVPGGQAASGSATPGGSNGSHASTSPAGTPGEPSTAAASSTLTSKSGRKGSSNVRPLAATRGENWGLPNRGQSSTGFTRFIQVQCWGDRLMLMPEANDHRLPVVVPIPDDTSKCVDSFVTAIWKRTESWGIAAENGYWKPVLRVQVQPGAEDRFEELSVLLQGSGLVVERKQ